MLIELITTFLLLLLIWDYLSRKERNDILGNMPGPRSLPFLGSVLIYRGKSPEDVMQFIIGNRQRYGSSYRIWIMRQLAIFSCDVKDMEIVLSSQQHIKKNNLYDLLHVWLGKGLLMSWGPKWHARRKIITPTFHFKILEQFVEVFEQQSAVLVKKLHAMADGKTVVNITPIICLYALDIIAETAMGTKINAQMQPDLPYAKAVTTATNLISKRFVDPWKRIDWIYRLKAPKEAKLLSDSIKVMHNFTERIITEHRQKLEATIAASQLMPTANGDDQHVGLKRRMALLDVLLQSTIADEPLSNADIREEVDTFMFEGHDTTTSGMSFCLYLISRHPAVQQKLYDELNELLDSRAADKNSALTLRDFGELKYLECVIKESLRLYPPVPLIGRYFEEDAVINGRTIPAGTNFILGLYVLLREPAYFTDPHSFKPERFEGNNSEQLNPFAYVPFSAGPRNCIGQKFAMLEMKSSISNILRHFELLPLGDDVRPSMNLVLRSANGIQMGLKPRVV